MKKRICVLICFVLLLVLTLSSCKNKNKVKIEFTQNNNLSYEWNCVVSKDGIVEVKESYKKNRKEKNKVTKIYTVIPVAAGEVTLDFSYSNPEDEDISCAATYVFSVDKDLKITEKYHEGTYFDLQS